MLSSARLLNTLPCVLFRERWFQAENAGVVRGRVRALQKKVLIRAIF